ncbi:UNVERIFIED_CONTAM: hypothetical protein K2H54_050387 [Gekko kuhli]
MGTPTGAVMDQGHRSEELSSTGHHEPMDEVPFRALAQANVEGPYLGQGDRISREPNILEGWGRVRLAQGGQENPEAPSGSGPHGDEYQSVPEQCPDPGLTPQNSSNHKEGDVWRPAMFNATVKDGECTATAAGGQSPARHHCCRRYRCASGRSMCPYITSGGSDGDEDAADIGWRQHQHCRRRSLHFNHRREVCLSPESNRHRRSHSFGGQAADTGKGMHPGKSRTGGPAGHRNSSPQNPGGQTPGGGRRGTETMRVVAGRAPGAAGMEQSEAQPALEQERWRATLRQSGIEKPVQGILESACRKWQPPWEMALHVWAFLVLRIDLCNPGNRAGPREGGLWPQLTGLGMHLQEAWTGQRSDVGTERALALEVAEHLLGNEDSCCQAGEPPTWLSVSHVAAMLGDIERQLKHRTGGRDAPTVIAVDSVETRQGDGQKGPQERLGTEWWQAALRAIVSDLWRYVRKQEERDAAGRTGGATATASSTAGTVWQREDDAAQGVWDATMGLTGFHHVAQILETGRNEQQPEWELALRVWGYLVARINEHLWGKPADLPPDDQLWERLNAMRASIQGTWVDRWHDRTWEHCQVLDIIARLLGNSAARQRAGTPPPWLTIGTLAGTLEDVYNDLQRAEGRDVYNDLLRTINAW